MEMWAYREGIYDPGSVEGLDLAGFGVDAVDGAIGKIDAATFDVGASYVVVDTGPWIFGKKVILPAGVIDAVDFETNTVSVNRTKDEIKDSPRFDEATFSERLRDDLGSYYSARGGTDREF